MTLRKATWVVLAVSLLVVVVAPAADAPKRFTIEQVLGPAYPSELIAARKADRLAWIAYEKGMRNVYTAVAPSFKPVRLTANLKDDGNDLTNLQISADGSIVTFVRGHLINRDGWVANPTSDPKGSERAVWAIRSTGGNPWKLAEIDRGDPELSPDGRWVVFIKDGQIHGVRIDPSGSAPGATAGKEPLFRAWGRNSNPVWSPDSRRIAFVSNREDHTFIGIYNVDKPNVTYLSPSVDHDSSPTWSPDGKQVAFIRRPGTPFGVQVSNSPQLGPAGGLFPGGVVPQGRQGNAGRQGGGGRQGGRGAQQFQEAGSPPPPDGLNRAAFAGGYTLSFRISSVSTGEGREFWHNTPGDTELNAINRIQWAGSHVIFQVDRDNWEHYYSIPIDGSSIKPTELTPGEGFIENFTLSSDGKYFFGCTNIGDIDRRHIVKIPVAGGEAVSVTSGEGIETYPVVLGSGTTIAVLNAGVRQPLSVAIVSASGGQPKVLFPKLGAEFPSADHVVPENVITTAEDGLKLHNQVFVPRDLKQGERRPALVFIHGGPQRQMLLGYHYRHFYHMAYALNQYIANQGYIAISVNYRSGIGYGRDFRRAPRTGGRGNAEYQDIYAAGKYLQGRSDVDPQRIGVWGLSYGGVLTAQALARNSDIFAAGVDIAGIHLWGNSINKEDISYQASSISAIDKWKSPVLLIHGDDDRNVAFSQTTGLVQLLRAKGVYHELIVYPDDVHDTLLYQRWLKSFHAMDDFFKRFILKEQPVTGGAH